MNSSTTTKSLSASASPAPTIQVPTVAKLRKRAFTLLEVVIAMAMLAIIALPALGLAAMAVTQSDKRLTAGVASELKRRIDAYLSWNDVVFAASDSIDMGASEGLLRIEALTDGKLPSGERPFFKIVIKPATFPAYQASDPYRLVNYIVTWPEDDASRAATEKLVFTSVFRK